MIVSYLCWVQPGVSAGHALLDLGFLFFVAFASFKFLFGQSKL